MRNVTRILTVFLLLAAPSWLSGRASAQTGPYIGTDIGFARAPALTVHGADNDWGTRCDLIINPNRLDAPDTLDVECGSAPPRTSWSNALGGGGGIQAAAAFGYDWGAVRLEGEYLHRVTSYNERTAPVGLDVVTAEKQQQELERVFGGVGDVQSHNAFANVYYDFPTPSSAWSPYIGAGVGMERASMDYFSYWKRNDDPDRIATFADPLLRAKLAGTTTIGISRPTDTLVRYQVLAGVDYRISDPFTLGVKFRWLPPRDFEGEPTPWDELRSHQSSVGRGEQIEYVMSTDDNQFWGLSLSLKYGF